MRYDSSNSRAASIKGAIPLSSVIRQYTDLRRSGGELSGLCPFHDEKTPSFYVNDVKGAYHCFGCQASGDVITFVQDIENMDYKAACDHLEGNLQNGASNPSSRRTQPSATKQSDTVKAARRIWENAQPVARTPAELYLASRGIPLDTIAPQPNLRYASLRYDGSSGYHATLIAAIRDVDGEVIGIQRTYLKPDGQKLCSDAKRSLGRVLRGAIRLSAGEPEGWAKLLYICEGLEDGLSLLRIAGNAPVWVSAGAGMMESLVLPDDCQKVIIAPDNDDAGRRAMQVVGRKLFRQGREVTFMILSEHFKDNNEYLLHLLSDEDEDQGGASVEGAEADEAKP